MMNIKKILITVLSFLLLFAISCSNEGTTGGNTDDDDYYYNPENNNDNNDITPPTVTPGRLTASATKNITINIANEKVHSTGRIYFMVRPYELERAGNFSVSIDSVAKATGNNSSLELTPTDFNSLTPTTKELTLSTDGLAKVNAASDLVDATAYKYDVTLKFTTTSDTVTNKTVSYTSTISLYKATSVTEAMLKTMLSSTPNKTLGNRASDGFSDSFTINFNNAVSSASSLKSISINNLGGTRMTEPTGDSTYSPNQLTASWLFKFGTTETSKFISSPHNCNYTISQDGKTLTATYVFTLRSGYVLDDNISFITNDGIKLVITFLDKGKWVKDTI